MSTPFILKLSDLFLNKKFFPVFPSKNALDPSFLFFEIGLPSEIGQF